METMTNLTALGPARHHHNPQHLSNQLEPFEYIYRQIDRYELKIHSEMEKQILLREKQVLLGSRAVKALLHAGIYTLGPG